MKLIKIPYSQSGTELAPEEVLSQLSKNLSEAGILPIFEIDEIKVISTNIEETNNNIYNQAKEILKQNSPRVAGSFVLLHFNNYRKNHRSALGFVVKV